MAYGVGERHPEVELARLVPILRVAVRAHGEVARPWLQPQRGRPLHVERERHVGHRRAWFGIGLGLGLGSGAGVGVWGWGWGQSSGWPWRYPWPWRCLRRRGAALAMGAR